MFVGKNSWLKGFGLMFYLVVLILVAVGCFFTPFTFFKVMGIINLILGGINIFSLIKKFRSK